MRARLNWAVLKVARSVFRFRPAVLAAQTTAPDEAVGRFIVIPCHAATETRGYRTFSKKRPVEGRKHQTLGPAETRVRSDETLGVAGARRSADLPATAGATLNFPRA